LRFRALSRLHTLLGIAKWSVLLVGAVSGATLKANDVEVSKHLGPEAARVLVWMQGVAWIVVPLTIISVPIIEGLRNFVGAPSVWRVVRDVLDQFRSQLFPNATDDQLHEHRVTLFQFTRWHFCARKWPWSGWLFPVERSGHTTQKTNIVFLAPDEADKVEGVAGMTWSRRQVVHVKDLPDLSVDFSDQAIGEYAKRSWMPENVVRQRKPRARSLVGIPVEVKSEIWGVIVVDSRKPEIKQADVKKHYKFVARFLGKTLEGL
jgi:hypothetical protein